MNKINTVIIGGGISGLNTAYQIIKKHPKHRILIIEGSNRLGGRLNTIKYKGTQYEAGGARFNNKHSRLLKLLNDFTINKFIKGIVDHVEILEINKKIPSINDVFIKATTDE